MYYKRGIFSKVQISLNKDYMANYFYQDWHLNELIGKEISFQHIGPGVCLGCGNNITSYVRGKENYCRRCYNTLPYTDWCMFYPEKCHYHLGTCRDPHWGRTHCFQNHFLYLAFSYRHKIGVTRSARCTQRFLEQGASCCIPILRTKSRIVAGKLEHVLKSHFSHTTSPLRMLKVAHSVCPPDLWEARTSALNILEPYILLHREDITLIEHVSISPLLLHYPHCVPPVSCIHNILKSPQISGTLLGIKGQYLILSTGVLNYRSLYGKNYEIVIK